MSYKILKLDEFLCLDHSYLSVSDNCYYLREYTARAGYAHSPTNQLISNFKKPLNRKGKADWGYKDGAINEVANNFIEALNGLKFEDFTLVPIPPSKAKDHPEYDDRMSQAIRKLCEEYGGQMSELILCNESKQASHTIAEGEPRPNQFQIAQNLKLDENEIKNLRRNIILFDDVVTTGAHFKACKQIIMERLPNKQIVGLFLARTIRV
ncbi:hypothetical protein [Aquimarina algicola]|uniref:ComF family protein n=1 Tax=Aquimarina algicola TaxID=2589995 RepID=A0A504JKR7_9FLAO|nr:hypothetical protein [Aquimarina algicola]TPN87141.1 hypothetical protein FHK87_05990 [Aquimarina algicola]